MTDDATLVEETDADTAELADELFRVAEDTTADGRVRVEIRELNKRAGGKEIEVRARLPSQREFIEPMDYPERDDTEYKFVRLCRAAGYSLAAAEQLDGATVEAEQDDDGEWQFVAPEEKGRFAAAKQATKYLGIGGAIVGGIAVAPLALGLFMWVDPEEPGEAFDSVGEMILVWVFVSGFWWVCARALAGIITVGITGQLEVPL